MIVIRYEGPKGGPGMKEMLNPTSMVMGAGLGQVREMGGMGETGETRWDMDKM